MSIYLFDPVVQLGLFKLIFLHVSSIGRVDCAVIEISLIKIDFDIIRVINFLVRTDLVVDLDCRRMTSIDGFLRWNIIIIRTEKNVPSWLTRPQILGIVLSPARLDLGDELLL